MFYWLGIVLLLACSEVFARLHLSQEQQYDFQKIEPALDLNVLVKDNNYYYGVADHDETNEDKINMNDEYTDFVKEFDKNFKEEKVIHKKTKHQIARGGKHTNLSSKESVHKIFHKFKKKNIPRKNTLPMHSTFETSNGFEEVKVPIKIKSKETEFNSHLYDASIYQDLTTKFHKASSGMQKKENKIMKHESDNVGVATVTEDNNISKEEELIQSVNPFDIFLEPSISNITNQKNFTTSSSSPSYHAHTVEATNGDSFLHKLDSGSFIALIVSCCVAGVAGIVLTGYCWFKLGHEHGGGNKIDVSNSNFTAIKKEKPHQLKKGSNMGDEMLAENAKMFHYVHQKKQMQQLSKNFIENNDLLANNTDDDDDENTVYECPGLAPSGNMKIVNPLFSDSENYQTGKYRNNSLKDAGSPPPPYEGDH